MPITRQRALEYVEAEWGTYVKRFDNLTKVERNQRVREMGYQTFRDVLAHILAWWEEGMDVVLAVAEDRPFERKKYDFDVFNAQAVEKYQAWNEDEFMAHFEGTRQKMGADLKSMKEAAFENRRVRSWIRGIIIHHAREHLVTLSRFLVVDLLENEWADYIEDFNRLNDEKRKEFLSNQGFATFHDLLAHVIGWWEEGARIITGILDTPGFTWQSHDVDAFNMALTKKYASWSDEDLFKHFHTVRKALINLTADLPEDAFLTGDIAGWLKDDVVEHYDEHPIPN